MGLTGLQKPDLLCSARCRLGSKRVTPQQGTEHVLRSTRRLPLIWKTSSEVWFSRCVKNKKDVSKKVEFRAGKNKKPPLKEIAGAGVLAHEKKTLSLDAELPSAVSQQQCLPTAVYLG